LAERVEATVRVRGDAEARDAFRRHANAQLAAEFPEVRYRELHDRDQLDWRLACEGGVPFPPFVEASAAYPQLECIVEWREVQGAAVRRARLAAGGLEWEGDADVPAKPDAGAASVSVLAARDGELRHAMVMERARGTESWLGYLATAERHAFFLYAAAPRSVLFSDGLDPQWCWRATVAGDGATIEALAPPEAMSDHVAERLHHVAERFAADWLWFDAAPEAETAIERHRYAHYGVAVRPANLQSRKLKRVLVEDASGLRLDPSEPGAAEAAALVLAAWAALQRS
jgi:hypothetical protein